MTGGSERPAPSSPPRGAGRARTTDPDPTASADLGASAPAAASALATDELEVLLRVGEMLRKLRFGTVLLVIHDGRVVQIETAEKIRL